MASDRADEEFEVWLHDLLAEAQEEFGLSGWTIDGLRLHFYAHFEQRLSPYQALRAEEYESLEDMKARLVKSQ